MSAVVAWMLSPVVRWLERRQDEWCASIDSYIGLWTTDPVDEPCG